MLKMLLALQNRRANRGFTLIELLVVVAIIGLLATFALPRVFEAINKAKGGVGGADLNTISSAMERYYFENNGYPKSAAATASARATEIMNALKGDYVKAATTFKNGFGKGYIYITDANGSFYVLIDSGNNPTSGAPFKVTCGTTAPVWTYPALNAAVDFDHKVSATTPSATNLKEGCVLAADGTSTFSDATAKAVTN